MSRSPLPHNLALRDAILWAMRDGTPTTMRQLEEILAPQGRLIPPGLTAQVQGLCGRGDLERLKVDGQTVAYRRRRFEPLELEARFEELVAGLDPVIEPGWWQEPGG